MTAPSRTVIPQRLVRAALALATLAVPSFGQCSNQWLPGDGLPGLDGLPGTIQSFDPDGPGPLPEVVYLAGEFTVAGKVAANNVASFDPISEQFHALGSGTNGWVRSLVVLPTGDVVVSGDFTSAGGIAANHIARWNGSSWQSLAGGVGAAAVLAVAPNGDVFAGGNLSLGTTPTNLARWNGSTWQSIAGAPASPYAMTFLANGDLVVGSQSFVNGAITRWDGTTWSNFGSGMSIGVESLLQLPNGDLLAGGMFATAGGVPANKVARWNGSAWSAMGTGLPWISVKSLHVRSNGTIVATGEPAYTVPATPCIAEWNGAGWILTSHATDGPIRTATKLANDELLVVGDFRNAASAPALNMCRWDGVAYRSIGSGADLEVLAMATLPNGDLVAAGRFGRIGNVLANHIARWDGTNWHALGTGTDEHVAALLVMPNGDLVASGGFTMAGGTPANHVAKWNGTQWSPLGGGFNYADKLVLRNGRIVSNGRLGSGASNALSEWNGSSWQAIGPFTFQPILGLAVDAQSNLFVCSRLPSAAPGSFDAIIKWDGTTWTPVAGTLNVPFGAIAFSPNGELHAANATSGTSKWNGTAWQQTGCPVFGVRAIGTLPGGQLIATGALGGTTAAPHHGMAIWDGATWSRYGTSQLDDALPSNLVLAFAGRPNGDIVLGGHFAALDGFGAGHLATLRPGCPATAVSYGSGCAGPGGLDVLTVAQRPWSGGAYRAVGTGMSTQSIVLSVYGFTQLSLPLPSVLPQGLAGCTVATTGDYIDVLTPTGGTVASTLPIPANDALAGLTFFHYLLPFEFAAGSLATITASNGMALTIGSY